MPFPKFLQSFNYFILSPPYCPRISFQGRETRCSYILGASDEFHGKATLWCDDLDWSKLSKEPFSQLEIKVNSHKNMSVPQAHVWCVHVCEVQQECDVRNLGSALHPSLGSKGQLRLQGLVPKYQLWSWPLTNTLRTEAN